MHLSQPQAKGKFLSPLNIVATYVFSSILMTAGVVVLL